MVTLQDYSCVLTDGTCEDVKGIFIWECDGIVAVCLLKVRVTVLRKYLYVKLAGM